MKKAKDLTEAERIAALAEIRRAPEPEPLDMTRTAREMTGREQLEWLAAHRRRFGV
jgi:hypothetical protein